MFKSIPLFSGSSGNCVYVKDGEDELLIDAGVSYKNICLALEKAGSSINNIKAVLVTHEHSDHIKGLDVLSKHTDIPIYINTASLDAICNTAFSFTEKCVIANPGDNISVGKIKASIFATPHDSSGSVGYRFCFEHGDCLGYATDIGQITDDIKCAMKGCKTVIFESNHDITMLKSGPYPYVLKQRILSPNGHLSNDACSEFLPELVDMGTKKIILAHLSRENNTPDIAYTTAVNALVNAGFSSEDVKLTVAMTSVI